MSKKHKQQQAKRRSNPASNRRSPAPSSSTATTKVPWPAIAALAIAVVLIGFLIWYFGYGPGKTVSETPTPAATTAAPTEAPAVTTAAPTEASPAAQGSMPADPAARNGMYTAAPAMTIDPARHYQATITTTKGNIVVDLDAQAAPQTVNNFVFLARQGFYDGLTFHRVEPGFVIQGGDPLGTGTGGPGYTVPAEIGLLHDEGVIATARLSDAVNPERASSGSQFYITLAPVHQLDGAYTVFGKTVQGMDVVKSIAVGDVIQKITISEQ